MRRQRASIRLTSALLTGAVVLFAASSAPAEDSQPAAEAQAEQPKADEVPSQEELDRRFEELLDNSQLIGFFTEGGKESEAPLKADKYTIENVKKLKNGFWLFEARIQYNDQDRKVPLPVQVKWAGDTPVITLTKVFVPGFGTFTARVLFYGTEYAGTWSANDHGGHMFGRIEKLGEPKTEAAEAGN